MHMELFLVLSAQLGSLRVLHGGGKATIFNQAPCHAIDLHGFTMGLLIESSLLTEAATAA